MSLKIKIHDNGWTVLVDENIKDLTDQELYKIVRLVMTNSVVVFKKQNLTEREELDICTRMGRVVSTTSKSGLGSNLSLTNGIVRVTGKKNENGLPGLFPDKETVDWHADFASWRNRKPLLWLYAAEGSAGSRTSWLTTINSYKNLDENFKKYLSELKMFCGYKQGNFSNSDYFLITNTVNWKNSINLVQTNAEGITGVFFPFLQIFGFENKSEQECQEIIKSLSEIFVQEQYMYHHDWEDGDLVISDEWLSLHKRWEFEGIDTRVMHRISVLHSNVYPIY